jgi:outer membrane lipoprotein carrier protein
MRLAIVALVIPLSAIAQPKPERTAAQVLADVETTYAKPQHLTAKFEQTVTYATMGTTKKSAGTVYLAKPDKMRWDYVEAKQKRVDKSFIFDGTTLWVVEPSNLQVLKHTAQNHTLPAAISFLNQSERLAKEFDVAFADATAQKTHGVPGGVLLSLVPKQAAAQIKQLYFVIDPSTNQVARSIVIDSSDNVNAFAFRDADLKKKLDAKYFAFDPKTVPTYKVVTVEPPKP